MISHTRVVTRGLRLIIVLALMFGVMPIDVVAAQPASETAGVTSPRSAAAPVIWARAEASQPSAPQAPSAVSITATKRDALVTDVDGDNRADPGDTLEYTVIVSSSGTTDATGVQFNDTLDANTTLVGGSLSASPVAVNDTYPETVVGNVSINSALIPFSVLSNDYLGLNPAATITAYDATSANGGNVAVNADGTFTYDPPPGFEGTDTFSYTLSNSTGSNVGVVSISVSGMVWFINSAAPSCTAVAAGCGRLSKPFSTLAAFNSANGVPDVPASHIFNPAANDNIFVYESATAYGGAVTLVSGQKLIGQDATVSLSTITGLTPPSSSASFPVMNSANGTATNIGSTLTLNNNVTVRGLQINSTTSTGLSDPAAAIAGVSVSEVSVATTTGTAVLLSGLGGTLTLRSVSANGAVNGVSLANTTGSFTITGDGTNNASGGTIQNTTGDGVLLSNAQNISLTSLRIQNTAHSGVKGSNNVQNFSFINGTINNSGTPSGTGDSNIAFNKGAYSPTIGNEKNLTGAVTITGSTLTNAFYHGIDIFQFDGTITNLNISNNTLTSSTNIAASLGSGIRLVGFGSASTVASFSKGTINANTITNFPSDAGILFLGGNANSASAPAGIYGTDTGANAIAITNNIISGQSAANQMGTQGINTALNGRGTGNVMITGNSITNVKGLGIGIGSNGLTTYTAIVTGNTINAHNIFASAGIGGGTTNTFAASDTPTLNTQIANNNISNTDGNGILMNAISASGHLNARILNNTVAAPIDNPPSGTTYGIRVAAGNISSVDDAVCLEISGNTTAGDNDGAGTIASGIGLRKQFTNSTINDFGIVGMAATSSPGVENYVNSQNPGSAPGSFGVGGTTLISASSGFSNCSMPPVLAIAPAGSDALAQNPTESKPLVHTAANNTDLKFAPSSSTINLFKQTSWHEVNDTANDTAVAGYAPSSGETVNVSVGTLPSGKSITFKFRATINNPVPPGVLQVSNQGTVSGSNFASVVTDDPDTSAPNDPTVTPLDIQVDLQVTKTVNPSTAHPGSPITYTLTYLNAGPQASANVTISDPIPSALTGVSYQSSATITPTGSYVWTIGTLLSGQGGAITVTGTISPALLAPTTITNTAIITGTGRDTNIANNTASVGLPVTDQPISGLNAANDSPTQLGIVTHFTATVNAGTSVVYQWNFGDGASGNGATSAHTYAAVGTYTATVTATNSSNSQVATTVVKIVDMPISGLSASNDSPTRIGNATHFTVSLSTGSNVTYAWNFGDGATGSGLTPAHTYAALGTYTATVTATNSINQQVATTIVIVIDQPITGLTATNDSPTQVGNTTHFTATISGGTNVIYQWNFGDGSLGNGANASHNYGAAGPYIATVTATNGVSVVVATTNVSIIDRAIVGLSATNSSPTGLGNSTFVTATISDGTNVTYAWNFGDGNTGGGANTSHIYGAIGIYTATVTATNSVSVVTASTVVTIVDQLISGLSAASSSPTPLGSVTAFTATITTGSTVSYTWNFGDGSTGSGVNATHTYVAIGTYTATVTATNNLNSQTASTVVVVIDRAIAGLSASNDSPTRLGGTTAFTATIGAGSHVTYAWNFGDGATDSGATSTHAYGAVGSYTATVTATNSVSVVTATTNISIIDTPIVGLMAANSGPTGLGLSTALTATIGSGSNVGYAWNFGDGSTGSGALTSHIYPALGLYTATVTATNGVSNAVATTLVMIVDQPLSNLNATSSSPTLLGNTSFFTATANGTSVVYAWNFGDGLTGGGAHPSHVYTATGQYTAIVTATNSTGSLTTTTKVNVFSGKIYLPLIMRNYVSAPDLIVTGLKASTGNVQVVIKNQGDRPVTDGFYVDVYINPQPAPTAVNQIWSDGRSAQGLTWGVTASLQPGQVLTLTIGDAYYLPDYSIFTGMLPVGTPVYAQVDSFDPTTSYGAVLENHEINGAPYNNILGAVSSTSTFAALSVEQAIEKGNAGLPSRLKVR